MTPVRRRVLVTGGTRGIGAAIAAVMLESGWDVTVTGSGPDGVAPSGCSYMAADFSDTAGAERFAAKVADCGFSALINNAGVNEVGAVEGYSLDKFERILDVNLVAPFLLCRAVVPAMRAQRFGRIVNITSIFGVVSRAGRSAYSASKFGLFGLSRALALEVAADNVLVNCVAPGFVDTDLTRRVLGDAGIAEMVRQVPMGRLAAPEEIARAVAFLCGDQNTFMTGQTIVIDGGFTSV